jgi:hypothetical protein
MTKVTKWWIQFSFWDKIRLTLGGFGIGGEITLFLVDSHPDFKKWAAIITFVSIIITYFFKDENKNGIVDLFERFKKSK